MGLPHLAWAAAFCLYEWACSASRKHDRRAEWLAVADLPISFSAAADLGCSQGKGLPGLQSVPGGRRSRRAGVSVESQKPRRISAQLGASPNHVLSTGHLELCRRFQGCQQAERAAREPQAPTST